MSDEEAQTDEIPEHLAEFKRQLEKIVKRNIEIEEDLRRQGIGPNPAIIHQMRFDLLLSLILTPEQRFDFEIQSAQKVHDILMYIQQEQASKKLITPGNGNGLLVPRG